MKTEFKQNNYIVYLAVKLDGKVKIDYSTYGVEEIETGWKSKVSSETFDKKDFKKNKYGFSRIVKKDGNYFSWCIINSNNDNFEEVEKEILPIAANILYKKMHNHNYRISLTNRVKEILSC